MKISKNLIIAILLLAFFSQAKENPTFCWKDSYGRGVGTVPNDCGPHRDKRGALCYDKCPPGYQRKGFDCRQKCPGNLRDDGLFCRAAEYGRGGGFPWKARDGVRRRTRDNGMISRCESQHGRGNCEKWGAMYYPKCRPGFHPAGCCICRPSHPDCNALGMGRRVGLSCTKKIQHRRPQAAGCPPDREYNAGLCYKRCSKGFYGVGPVCWGQPPAGWINCGMAAAKNQDACSRVITNQVLRPVVLGLTIASGKSGSRPEKIAVAGESLDEFEEVRKLYDWPKCSTIS